MNPLKGLSDPYSHLDDDKLLRLQADVAAVDLLLIRSVVPFKGVLQSTVNTIIHSIANELRASNITTYDPDNLAAYIAIVQRRANPLVAGQAADGDVGIRVKGVHDASALPASPAAGAEVSADNGTRKRQTKGRTRPFKSGVVG